jgi:hypothetical protein
MAPHLWLEHQLLLQGKQARKPWPVLEEWAVSAARDGNRRLLSLCRTLGAQLDPATGRIHIDRVLLAKGVDNAEARGTVYSALYKSGGTLCPHCYTLLPQPPAADIPRSNLSRGRLAIRDFVIDVSERGLVPWLSISGPHGPRVSKREPGRRLTARGFAVLFILPVLALALVLATGLVRVPPPVLLPVGFLLWLALVLALGERYRRRKDTPAADRAIHHAWTLVPPALHGDGFNEMDAGFLSSLAQLTCQRGALPIPNGVPRHVLAVTDQAVGEGKTPALHLAALMRAHAADRVARGDDAAPLVAAQVGRCLSGRLPLAYAEELLAGWETPWWGKTALARLRVLVCDKAFEAAFEIGTLRAAGRGSPALGEVLGLRDVPALASLRLLWSLRPTRPWDHCGPAETAFEMAVSPLRGEAFGRRSDLLLVADLPPLRHTGSDEGVTAQSLFLCSTGIVFRGKRIGDAPDSIDVVNQRLTARGGYDLYIGTTRFHFHHDPQPLVPRLERWSNFFFKQFLPQVTDVTNWKAPDEGTQMRVRGALECPECSTWLLPRRGGVGAVPDVETAAK